MIAVFACAAILQQKQLVETKYFPGGSQSDLIVFLRLTGTFVSSIYEDRIAKAFGPMRCMRYSDGSKVYDPPLNPIVEMGTRNKVAVLRSRILPLKFLTNEIPTASTETDLDNASQVTEMVQGKPVTSTRGSMRLGNGLPLLGVPIDIHPFFADFWVNVSIKGQVGEIHLDHIAYLVGGKLVKPTAPGGNYYIEPDVSAIRSRLLLTLDYKSPSKSIEAYEKRESIVNQMIRSMSDDQLRRWIDAAKKPFRFSANELSNYKDIKAYRDTFVEFAAKTSPGSFTPQNVESIRASAIEIEFDRMFSINFYATLANGKQLRF